MSNLNSSLPKIITYLHVRTYIPPNPGIRMWMSWGGGAYAAYQLAKIICPENMEKGSLSLFSFDHSYQVQSSLDPIEKNK